MTEKNKATMAVLVTIKPSVIAMVMITSAKICMAFGMPEAAMYSLSKCQVESIEDFPKQPRDDNGRFKKVRR